jgi:hypothetical protein
LCQRVLQSATLYELLLRLDQDLAKTAKAAGCSCGGRLDSARYPRKPRGWPPISAKCDAAGDHWKRLSFCCSVDGCRKRTTPPSTRFLGRRVYLAATVVLVMAMLQGITSRRAQQLGELYDVPRRTLERWRTWWLEAFAETELWRAFRGRFMPPVDEGGLPRSLVERFGRLGQAGLVGVLRFLAPHGASEHVRRRALADPQKMRFDVLGGGP